MSQTKLKELLDLKLNWTVLNGIPEIYLSAKQVDITGFGVLENVFEDLSLGLL